jgi:hypothetical protein
MATQSSQPQTKALRVRHDNVFELVQLIARDAPRIGKVFEIALWTGQQGRTLVWVNEQPHSTSAINARGLKRNRPAGSGVLSSYKSKLNCGFDDAAPADELPFWTRLPGVLLF